MNNYEISAIGKFHNTKEGVSIELAPEYRLGLQALDGFSHIVVIWWFSDFDTPDERAILETPSPYKNSPEIMGIFATRSPVRPNPLALSTVEILSIDYENGIIHLPYADANDNTPVLDIKPYTPSLDRIEYPAVPDWCSSWPKSVEESGDFDWESVFNF